MGVPRCAGGCGDNGEVILDRLAGMSVPSVHLASTAGETVDLAEAARGRLVLYVYPRTGVPGEPLPTGWDEIPGARGCTPQNCAFRDHSRELSELGATVYGLSAQALEEQRGFAELHDMPYPLLNDTELRLASALRLPTFQVDGMRLYRRLALVAEKGLISRVFHPVSAPERNARDVVEWLRLHDRRLELLRTAYDAFNARDVDAALARLHPAVEWPDLIEGGVLRGREQVRRYWREQFKAIDPTVRLERGFERDDELVILVRQRVCDARSGDELDDRYVAHAYQFRDGLIARMAAAASPIAA
jgi:peroxiredoxin/ketosteroid isomerase-like protein